MDACQAGALRHQPVHDLRVGQGQLAPRPADRFLREELEPAATMLDPDLDDLLQLTEVELVHDRVEYWFGELADAIDPSQGAGERARRAADQLVRGRGGAIQGNLNGADAQRAEPGQSPPG